MPKRARGRREVAGGADRQTRLVAAVAAAVTAYLEAEASAVRGPLPPWPVRPASPAGWVMAGRRQAMLEGQLINPRKGPHPR